MHRLQDARRNSRAADCLISGSLNKGRQDDHLPAVAVGRFAPSPTGLLHLGSLLAALASYCDTRSRQGLWQLRIDDIDGPRSMPGSADAIQKTLEALGFEWDGPVLWQGRRLDRYREALQYLIDRDLVFACNCSRKSLPRGEIYPGRCRDHPVDTFPLEDHAIRVRLSGTVAFDDAVQGPQTFDLSRDVGDSIVWRRDGLVSYALACAVDDADKVTHVVRGADLLAGTGAQLGIIKALDLTPPEYAHVPVAMDANGDKLSKHSQACPVDESDPLEILQRAWQLLGQQPLPETGSLADFWQQAIPAWQMNRVPRTRQMSV